MPTEPYTTGTIAVTNNSTTVTGTGVSWFPAIVTQGDMLLVPSQGALGMGIVDSVDGTYTIITLFAPWPGATASALPYMLLPSSWQRYDPALTQAQTRQLLALLTNAGLIYYVTGSTPDPGIGQDGQYALKTNSGAWQLWLKVSGAWVLQSTPIGTNFLGSWSSSATYVVNDSVSYSAAGPTSTYTALAGSTNVVPGSNPSVWGLSASAGENGNTLWSGTGAPSTGLGQNGDFYIDVSANVLYGPKASGAWPTGVSIVGPTGPAGTSLRAGPGAPASGIGNNGDWYIDDVAFVLYGPKASGVWPSSGMSLVGPQGLTGAQGVPGATGPAGANGNTIRYGSGAPASTLGAVGDFYIDDAADVIYGPKASGGWPAGTSIVGPQGIQGEQGQGLAFNASGTLANRSTYDNVAPPFVYLETDVSPFVLWAKGSNTTGDWNGPMPIGGTAPVGDLGQVTDTVLETFDYGVAA